MAKSTNVVTDVSLLDDGKLEVKTETISFSTDGIIKEIGKLNKSIVEIKSSDDYNDKLNKLRKVVDAQSELIKEMRANLINLFQGFQELYDRQVEILDNVNKSTNTEVRKNTVFRTR